MVQGTLVEKLGVPSVCDALGNRCDDAGFADAFLAGDENDLPLALPSLPLACAQKRALFFTIDESGQTRGMRPLETALQGDDALDRPRRDRLGKSLEVVSTEVAQAERIREQPARGAGDDDLSGLRQALQSRGEIRGIADERIVPQRAAAAEIAHDHEAARDADADRERLGGPGLEPRRALDDVERRSHRSLGVIPVGARVAEIRQDAVAAKIAEEAVIGLDDLRAGRVKGIEDRGRVFRIEPGRQGRRPYEVADHDRQMATLCNLRLPDGAFEKLGFAGLDVGECRLDRLEKPFSVAERYLELFEIGLGDLRQHIGVDGMLGEQRLISLET